ncbi:MULTISPECIES: hypothetical protein [unclassified Variovorax]|uniref:hypothetical protein n=1 Tax=unclassified Variovorax TaxID=663243 RepID=UPI00076D9019|nr:MULTISPECIES: hypothetical protein [unclassified Variovorax]KWT91735.1 hypothetical protein APY03_3172 [Variovorax sp. WDL1]PNG53323.1 hypothetical protein CHC06_04670 [Variovorax sp. B2]PNG53895.1 hypothetical protein CHC07_03717 [Variovorax sp. B4]VTV11360.1 hypothetical protein WDL1CHR_02231 [Variovorax sp. WDL1]
MSDTHIKPLSAWPQTAEFKTPDGLSAFRVSPDVLTPERARAADTCADILRLALFVGCGYGFLTFYSAASALIHAGAWLGVVLAGNALVRRNVARLFRATTEIEMTTEKVGVRRGKCWVWFPRRIEHRFAHKVHDRARWEERENDVERQAASMDRQVARMSYYYADSFHVALELAGHRYDLLTVYGPQEAAAVLARLQYLDRLLDAAIKIGSGVPEQPGDEWHDAPGDVA